MTQSETPGILLWDISAGICEQDQFFLLLRDLLLAQAMTKKRKLTFKNNAEMRGPEGR